MMRFPSIDTPSALIMRLTNTNFRNACVGYLGDTDAVHHVWFPSIWDYAILFGVMYAEPFLALSEANQWFYSWSSRCTEEWG